MHSPDAGSAKWACLDLQKVYDFYLRVVCGLSSSTPSSMLLEGFASTSLLVASNPVLLEQHSSLACGQLFPHCLAGQFV